MTAATRATAAIAVSRHAMLVTQGTAVSSSRIVAITTNIRPTSTIVDESLPASIEPRTLTSRTTAITPAGAMPTATLSRVRAARATVAPSAMTAMSAFAITTASTPPL